MEIIFVTLMDEVVDIALYEAPPKKEKS
jgi:hypothetical protein